MARKALITGVTGQDGSYLAQLLLDKGYEVFGTYRRASAPNGWRLNELNIYDRVRLICMELSDSASIQKVIEETEPDEVYNLAAQSFVPASFDQPLYTSEIDAVSVTRLLDAIRRLKPDARFYQASTSEMYGKAQATPQNEFTPFYPRSPYGVAKLYGHWITINYRESYSLYACAGILFNHESPLRSPEFITRKITSGFAGAKLGNRGPIAVGNLNAKRDWGFAGDYVEGIWRMLQQDGPDDFVLATGITTSIRNWAEMAARAIDAELEWQGEGEEEIGVDKKTGRVWITVDPRLYRPAEVDFLIGDAAKAKSKLGWQYNITIESLVEMIAKADFDRQKRM